MNKYSVEFLQKTIELWQKLCNCPLTMEDAREITENMTALFKFLDELDRKYFKEEKNGKE